MIAPAIENIRTLSVPGKDGYATFWDGNKYVQCRGVPAAPVRCEAAGSLMQPTLARILTPDRVARLLALGWAPDPSFGNYVRIFPTETATKDIAAAVVEALTQAYDARPDDLEIESDWIVSDPCPPRHGPTQNLAGMVDDASSMAATAIYDCAYTPGENGGAKGPVASAAALIARSGASVTAQIDRLRVNAAREVYVSFDSGIGYVQCAPQEEPLTIYCEAQSTDSWPALSAVLTPARIAELHARGYADPGRSPNYAKTYDAAKVSDADIANELLSILFDVYGYNGVTPLDVKTEKDP